LDYDYTDTDSNVATTITRTVEIVDTTAPIITLNGGGSLSIPSGTSYTEL
jgi:hypothetical protein